MLKLLFALLITSAFAQTPGPVPPQDISVGCGQLPALTGVITTSAGSCATSLTAKTGTGTTVVVQTSPTLITPVLGVATATSINGNAITAGTGTLTLGSVTLNAGAGGTLGSNAFTSTAYAPLASPTFTGTVTIPNGGVFGTPASMTATNITGTAAGLTAGTVTTNANLTGPITSSGNVTSIASQTGTGTKFVVDTSPTLVTPTIGVATATSITLGSLTTGPGTFVQGDGGANNGVITLNATSSIANGVSLILFNKASTPIANISYNSGTGGVLYNVTSDYRLKENIVPLSGAIIKVMELRPSVYSMKANKDHEVVQGFLAHEFQTVLPWAVTGKKDEIGSDGNPIYQSIDLSKAVPLLVAAIQEQQRRIEALEAR